MTHKHSQFHRAAFTLALSWATALSATAPCRADNDPPVPQVQVEGSRTSQLGLADSANAGTVTQKQLEMRTVYRPGELLEVTPGLVVSQHSGEGKANQFYLRGFNLDHGTDLRTMVDGMPVNQRSHAHGQGWTDLNFLIPELVSRLDYRKGPYSSQVGDFGSAGSVAIQFVDRLPQPTASVGFGQQGFARSALAVSPTLEQGAMVLGLEVLHKDGPFTRPDNFGKVNGMLRYAVGNAVEGINVNAMVYKAHWDATDQIPLRAVEDGSLGRYDAIDPTDGGAAHRYSVSASWHRTAADQTTKLNAFAIHSQLELFSNFTYFMDDPVNGDQFAQPDRRLTTGLNASHAWRLQNGEMVAGLQLQNDNIFNGLLHTKARQVLSTTRADHIVESSAGAFVEAHLSWGDSVRTVTGLRSDQYRFDVRSDRLANSGSTQSSITSPSFSIIYAPYAKTELYFNAGQGFHSNDARGTLTTIDPKTQEAADKVPGLVKSHGMEVGVRNEALAGLQTTLSLYRLDADSELVFVGDAGTTEAGRPSRRTGFELSSYYKATSWLAVDFDLAYAHARSRDTAPEGQYIPGAVEGVSQLALIVEQAGPWSGALRLRYFGPRPLIEDNSVRSKASLTLNGRVGYQFNKQLRMELEGFNLTNRRDSAIDYYYASRLKGEATAHDDIHFHPLESRSLRLNLVAHW